MSDYVPGLAGIPAARSSISFIDGNEGVLEYRGIRVETLAKESTFEEVSFLLLYDHLPTRAELDRFTRKLRSERRVPSHLVGVIQKFPKDAHPMAVLETAVSALAMEFPDDDNADADVREERALQIIAKIPTIVALFHRWREGQDAIEPNPELDTATDFLRMTTGEQPDALSAHIMDVCLILHADHTMNASTFTARVTGSTGASPFSVVSSAVGSLSGPLHGGANERVLIQLGKIGSKDQVRPAITGMIERREKIMGLGHRVYKTKDPRAIVLQGLANELFEVKGKSAIYDVAVELEDVAKELLSAKGIYPNVDFYSGIVYDKLGIQTDLFTPIFAIARAPGWLAHWLEQMADNRIFRPRQIYEGSRETDYVPVGER